MLSISRARSAASVVAYFSSHLVTESETPTNPNEDSYASEGEPGIWRGAGAVALGFAGAVRPRDFARVLLAVDGIGRPLVLGAGSELRRAGWDLVFSAPKSVSALWAAGDSGLRDALGGAHREAVDEALAWLESDGGIAARRGKGGREIEAARLVAAVFRHGTSRAHDPQVHSHAMVANLAQRPDGSWGAIQSREFFLRKMAAGACYRVALAIAMQRLGFSVRRDGFSFRISGVPQSLEKHWSQRRAQVVEVLAEQEATSALAAEAAALGTREAKQPVHRDVLQVRWRREATSHGLTLARIAALRTERHARPEMPAPAALWAMMNRTASTVSDHQLAAAVFVAAQGILDLGAARRFLREFRTDPETVTLRDAAGHSRFTSAACLANEHRIGERAKRRRGTCPAVSPAALAEAMGEPRTLSDAQRVAVRHITGPDGVVLVQGGLNAATLRLLNVARCAWAHDERRVLGCAPTGKGAARLEAATAMPNRALGAWLAELGTGVAPSTEREVLVVAAADRIGSRRLAALLQHTERSGTQVILVGDRRRLGSVDTAGALRSLAHALGAVELPDHSDRRDRMAGEAVRFLADTNTGRALVAARDRGLLHIGSDAGSVIKSMVRSWMRAHDPVRPSAARMIAFTRRAVARLNAEAREAFRDVLGPEVRVGESGFAVGDRILFVRRSRSLGVKARTFATITAVTKRGDRIRLSARTDDDAMVRWSPEGYPHIRHGYAVTADEAQGATVDRLDVLVQDAVNEYAWREVAAIGVRIETHFHANRELVAEIDQDLRCVGRNVPQKMMHDSTLPVLQGLPSESLNAQIRARGRDGGKRKQRNSDQEQLSRRAAAVGYGNRPNMPRQ